MSQLQHQAERRKEWKLTWEARKAPSIHSAWRWSYCYSAPTEYGGRGPAGEGGGGTDRRQAGTEKEQR